LKVEQIRNILADLEEYKPLTLRQVYYQMVSRGFIGNCVSEYNALSNLVKWARLDKQIPWEDIEDRGRVFNNLSGWYGGDEFALYHLKHFLTGYQRNLLQTQTKYIEVWIEKDALSTVFNKICSEFTVPVVVCKGFVSMSFLNDFRNRAKYRQAREGKTVVMLYFGNFDPSGIAMLDAMQTTLEWELFVTGVIFRRVALVEADIDAHNLPDNPNALKTTDSRARKFLETYGNRAVELDALSPSILEEKIRNAICDEIDIKLFEEQLEIQKREESELLMIKSKTSQMFAEMANL